MSREIYLGAALFSFGGVVLLAYLAYLDHSALVELRNVVEVEADVLRINRVHDLERRMHLDSPGSRRPECSADLRFDLNGTTHESSVYVTDGECRPGSTLSNLKVLVRPNEPGQTYRLFDRRISDAREGGISNQGIFFALFALLALCALFYFLWKAWRFPYRRQPRVGDTDWVPIDDDD